MKPQNSREAMLLAAAKHFARLRRKRVVRWLIGAGPKPRSDDIRQSTLEAHSLEDDPPDESRR